MTKEEKENIDLDILNVINSFVDPDKKLDGVLYIRGDAEFQKASVFIKGDAQLVCSTIQHHIENNDEFKRFIFAVIGSMLVNNQELKDEFMRGIELMEKTIGLN